MSEKSIFVHMVEQYERWNNNFDCILSVKKEAKEAANYTERELSLMWYAIDYCTEHIEKSFDVVRNERSCLVDLLMTAMELVEYAEEMLGGDQHWHSCDCEPDCPHCAFKAKVVEAITTNANADQVERFNRYRQERYDRESNNAEA